MTTGSPKKNAGRSSRCWEGHRPTGPLWRNTTAELGYYLAEEYWGKGIMSGAIRRICDMIFQTTDILRIYAEPFSYNAGSRRPQHIGGFFVDAAYHRRGIGRRLFEAMRQDYENQVFTVNSSPYAVEIYRRLGFVPTDTEQLADGLRYTPMRFEERIGAATPAGW